MKNSVSKKFQKKDALLKRAASKIQKRIENVNWSEDDGRFDNNLLYDLLDRLVDRLWDNAFEATDYAVDNRRGYRIQKLENGQPFFELL